MASADFRSILRVLAQQNVNLIVVGGVSALLQGVGIMTLDLDVLYSADEMNVARLVAMLHSLEAYYRMQPDRRIRPNASHLLAKGHNLLVTRYGSLDVLGTIGNGHDYADLIGSTDELDIGEGVKVRVLTLEAQIKIKEEVNREKDRVALLLLRRTLEEKRKRSPASDPRPPTPTA
jgi:hypothetical protein